jgi:Fe-S-cluster containining protein
MGGIKMKKNENVENVCATCKRCCCRHPLMIKEEVEIMAKELGEPIENIPVIKSDVKHLDFLDLEFFEMNNPEFCYAFEPGKGCKLPHDKKPVICRLYPWIPYNFENDDWELLLDVDACENWEVYGKTLKDVTQEFKEIREKNPERWRTK